MQNKIRFQMDRAAQMRGFCLFENLAGILLPTKRILIKPPFGIRSVNNVGMPTYELLCAQYEMCVMTVTNWNGLH